MAFNSGADSALLYESLSALGRGTEVGAKEAEAQRASFGALAVASVLGGVLAGLDLRIAYALSSAGALTAVALGLLLVEPPRSTSTFAPAAQLREVAGALRDPVLGWTFAFAVAMTVLAHVPYEFTQSYVDLLVENDPMRPYSMTPLLSGVLSALTMGLAALLSPASIRLRGRLGEPRTLLLALGILTLVIASMAAFLHELVLVLVLCRTVPMALFRPVSLGLIQPRIRDELRATFLSLQSLAGRLAFAGVLGAFSLFTDAGTIVTRGVLRTLLGAGTALAVAALVALWATTPRTLRGNVSPLGPNA
jgi:hypothetical protein